MKRKNVKIWVSNLEKYKNSKLEKCSTKGGGGVLVHVKFKFLTFVYYCIVLLQAFLEFVSSFSLLLCSSFLRGE